MTDSLVLANRIELLAGGVPSTIPECAGAMFRLAPGFDLSAPQPTAAIIASLVLDGERPVQGAASNRTPVLPVVIQVPATSNPVNDRQLLAAARECLIRVVSQDMFTLTWSRDSRPPLVLDCYSALPTTVDYDLIRDKSRVATMTVSFSAAPYGRSDVPEVVNLQVPLPGAPPPPASISVESFVSQPGNWLSSADSGFGPGIGAWRAQSGCTVARASGISHSGVASLALTATGTGDMIALDDFGTQGLPVKAGQWIGMTHYMMNANKLSGQNAGFEGGIGGWTAVTNCTVAGSSAQAHSGTSCLAVTSTVASGSAVAAAQATAQQIAVVPGNRISASAWFRANTAVHSCVMQVDFWDASHVFLSTQSGPAGIFDTSTGWTQSTDGGLITAPASAAFASAKVSIGTSGVGEITFVDDVAISVIRSTVGGVQWYDKNGTPTQQQFWLFSSDNSAGWSQVIASDMFAAPADGYAAPCYRIVGPVQSGEVHYVDDLIFGYDWRSLTLGPGGTSGHWDPSLWGQPDGQGLNPAYAAHVGPLNLEQGWSAPSNGDSLAGNYFGCTGEQAASINPGDTFQRAENWLKLAASGSIHNRDFEGTTGTWANAGNVSLSDTGVQAHSGANSLQLTNVAGGDVTAAHCQYVNIATNGLAVTPGQQIYASAWFRGTTVARAVAVGAQFFDAGGALLSPIVYGPGVTESTTGWTQATDGGQIVAPANAAYVALLVSVFAGGVGEIDYVDDAYIGVAAGQIFTVGSITAPFLDTVQVNFTPILGTDWVARAEVLVQCGPQPVLGALTLWAGFGSSSYFADWGLRGAGPVQFAITLYDASGNRLSFSHTAKVISSADSSNPSWQKIRVTLPASSSFSFANVVAYWVGVSSRFAGDLPFADLYLSQLQAVPLTNLAPVNPDHGAVYDLAGVLGSARSPMSLALALTGTATYTKFLRGPGGGQWRAPPGVTTVDVRPTGSGGGGGWSNSVAPGGASGGSTAHNAAVAVTPGKVSTWYAGRGGTAGTISVQPGGNGEASSFTSDLGTTVSAPGGLGSAGVGSTAGAAAPAAGSGGFAGGAGGAGTTGTGAGGGGSSAGTSAGGNIGQTGAAGSAGGAAVAGGGAGGRGARSSTGSAKAGSVPGGGGGGGGTFFTAGAGGDGQIAVTFSQTVGVASWLAHRPGPNATDTLCPYTPLDYTDLPDGTTEYPVPSLVPGQRARFGGTYTVLLSCFGWNNPSASRTVTVNVKHYEQPGGAVYTQSVTRTLTPSSLSGPDNGPLIRMGELTLPDHSIPPGVTNSYFTITVVDTNTGDRFRDALFIDTLGSTVMVQSPTLYPFYWIDEPIPGYDVGNIMGSQFGRDDAVSVLAYAWVSGPPLYVDPQGASQTLMLYAGDSGAVAPSAQMIYTPRWMLERLV